MYNRQDGPFRFWCQKVLPLTYDDSLSYYEMLCKIVNWLNNYTDELDEAAKKALEDLKKYIDEYFETKDLVEAVEAKLDKMAEDGTLSRLMPSETRLSVVSQKAYVMSEIFGGNMSLQGVGYNSTRNELAFMHSAGSGNCLCVRTDMGGNVINRVTVALNHGNDLAWCAPKNKWYVAYIGNNDAMIAECDYNFSNIRKFAPEGITTGAYYDITAISYDDVAKVFYLFANNGWLYTYDLDWKMVRKCKADVAYPSVLIPESNDYTAHQASFVVNGDFYMTSSVYRDASYTRGWVRAVRINTYSGELEKFLDIDSGITGYEQEGAYTVGQEVHLVGYSNTPHIICDIVLSAQQENDTRVKPANHTLPVRLWVNTAAGSNGDGLSADTPTRSLQGALDYASGCDYAEINLTGSVSGDRLYFTGAGAVKVIGGTINVDFVVRGGNVEFRDTVFNKNDDECVLAEKARVIFRGCTFNGNSTTDTDSRTISALNGSVVSFGDTTFRNSYLGVRLTDESIMLAGHTLTCQNVNRVVTCNLGSLAVIDKAKVTGATYLGYEYGGMILQARTQLVPMSGSQVSV